MALQTHLFNVLPDIFETAMIQSSPPDTASSNATHEEGEQTNSLPPKLPTSHQDVVAIKNLQLPFGVLAPDVWGKAKEQPVLASITLLLRGQGFHYAAQNDVIVPGATIHYGDLAKQVRAACTPDMSVAALSTRIADVVVKLGTSSSDDSARGPQACIVSRASIELMMPKAAMFGSGVSLTTALVLDEMGVARSVRRVWTVHQVKVMTLVGVHAYERTAKQPLVASVSLFWASGGQDVGDDGTARLFGLEPILAQETSYDTLEMLAEFVIAELSNRLLRQILPGIFIQLRLEKPRAIAFADAPVIEVLRQIPSGQSTDRRQYVPARGGKPQLVILKPYADTT